MLVALASSAAAQTRAILQPGPGETLIWRQNSDGDPTDDRYDWGLQIIPVYPMDPADRDSQDRPDPATFEKRLLSQTSLDLMTRQAAEGKVSEGYIVLEPIEGALSPADALILQYWRFQFAYEDGLMNLEEDKRSIRQSIEQARWERFVDIERELEAVPGLWVLDYLESLNMIHVEATPECLDALKALPYVKKLVVGDFDDTGESLNAGDYDPMLESMQLHGPFFVYHNGNLLWDGECDGNCTPNNSSFDNITVAIIDLNGFNGNHILFADGSGGTIRAEGAYECESTCVQHASLADAEPDDDGSDTPGDCNHGQQVAGSILGDLRDNQHPGTAYQGTGDVLAQMVTLASITFTCTKTTTAKPPKTLMTSRRCEEVNDDTYQTCFYSSVRRLYPFHRQLLRSGNAA